eukprot:gene10428-10586_t
MISTEQLLGLSNPLQQHTTLPFAPHLMGDTGPVGLHRQFANSFNMTGMLQSSQPSVQSSQVFNTASSFNSLQFLNGVVPVEPVYSPTTVGRVVMSSHPTPVYVNAPEQRSVFFAGVTPVVTSETLVALFGQFGRVVDLNLFKPWAGSKTSKASYLILGCGLVIFEDRAQAAAALAALNGCFQWPGARGPMVVEWMDVNKQHKKARAQPLCQPLMQHQFVAMQQSRATANVVPGQLCMFNQVAAPLMF